MKRKRIIGIIFIIILIFLTIIINYMIRKIEQDSVSESKILTVIIDPQNGEKVKEIKIKNGEKLKIDEPKKEEYIFSHWAKDRRGYDKFDLEEPVTNSMTLFASYDSISVQKVYEEKNITKENYNKIKNGMTKKEVIDILGTPDFKSEFETEDMGKTEMFYYQIGTNDTCQIYFSNGVVKSKNWTSL